jgi:two-component system, LuxR family, response regulator FixJ
LRCVPVRSRIELDQATRAQIRSNWFVYERYHLKPHDDFLMASSTITPVVYVVDDDTDVLGSLRFLLETDGFDVRTFRSGVALLNAISTGEVDCLVIDYKMATMSGLDLAERLRDREIDAPIILITGYPDANILEKAAAAGIHHVLLKPHLEESLVSRIRGAIQEGHPARR